MNPVLLKIGPLQVHWYGLLIVGGAVLAAWLCTVEAKRRGEDPEHGESADVVADFRHHRRGCITFDADGQFRRLGTTGEPDRDHRVLNGGTGLGIYGAVIGGVFALWPTHGTWRATAPASGSG
jgi:phosphatidylglycerol:prolipoprotein diacylglycerol transferase